MNTKISLPGYKPVETQSTMLMRSLRLFGKLALACLYGILVVLIPKEYIIVLVLPILLLAVLTLWMLPDTKQYPQNRIYSISKVYVALAIVWPVYLALDLPGLPWITPTRVALFLLVFYIVYSWSTSTDFRSQVYRVLSSNKGVLICLGIWEFMLIITIPLSKQPVVAMIAVANYQVYAIIPLIAGIIAFADEKAVYRLFQILIICTMFLCFDGAVEAWMQRPPWATHIPSFLRIDPKLLANILSSQARSADGLYRVRATYMVSLTFAEILGLMTPFVIHSMVSTKSNYARIALGMLLILFVWTILSTGSRLGVVAFLLSIFAYTGMWSLRRMVKDKNSIFGAAMVYGFPLIVGSFVAVVISSNTLTRKVLGGGVQAASDAARGTQRELAVNRMLSNPIGYGAGRSGETLGFVGVSGDYSVDNYAITTLMETGVIGVCAFFGIFIATGFASFRSYMKSTTLANDIQGPIAVALMVFLITKTVLSETTNHPLMFLIVGLAMAIRDRQPDPIEATV